LAVIIDVAVDLAKEYGWRYALAYLISERVPPQIIQRLMFDGGRARRTPRTRRWAARMRTLSTWRDDEMRRLFQSLQLRRKGGKGAPPPQVPSPDKKPSGND
jgi:hypothetical protein